MRWMSRRGFPAMLAMLAMALSACTGLAPSPAKPLSPPAKPRFTASASALAVTNEWRSVTSPAPAVVAPAAASAPLAPSLPASPAGEAPVRPSAADAVGAYRLRSGDPVVIYLRGIPREEEYENLVDEGGFVKLPYLERVKAAGLTCSQLEDDIERLYLDGKIYRSVSANVSMRAQSFFIQGEVKIPGRVPLSSTMTLLQAIAQAGGYTDYADETDVRIIRAGKTSRYNAKDLKRSPERDVRIEPGDVIDVGRSII